MNKWVLGEHLISDEDGFIYTVTKTGEGAMAVLDYDNKRSPIVITPAAAPLDELIRECKLRRFKSDELREGDEFNYNHLQWKVIKDDNGKRVATNIGTAVRSSAQWGLHHFKAHVIVVTKVKSNYGETSENGATIIGSIQAGTVVKAIPDEAMSGIPPSKRNNVIEIALNHVADNDEAKRRLDAGDIMIDRNRDLMIQVAEPTDETTGNHITGYCIWGGEKYDFEYGRKFNWDADAFDRLWHIDECSVIDPSSACRGDMFKLANSPPAALHKFDHFDKGVPKFLGEDGKLYTVSHIERTTWRLVFPAGGKMPMTIPERLDALLARLGDISTEFDAVQADVEMIRKMSGVDDD